MASFIAITAKPTKGAPKKRIQSPPKKEKQYYQCQCCGEKNLPDTDFYYSRNSEIWNLSDHRPLFCRKCVDSYFKTMMQRHGERNALIVICAMLDLPFVANMYMSVVQKNGNFVLSDYISRLNGTQYKNMTFVNTLLSEEMTKVPNCDEAKEKRWRKDEARLRDEVIEMLGYDPFDGYPQEDRKYLFFELSKYLDEDTIEDSFKTAVIIQIVNNNCQIAKYDALIAKLNPTTKADDIRQLSALKKNLTDSNDKLAKENEISVKNRSDKGAGKSTLTYLMRDLREKDFAAAEVNYYEQLRSAGTLWAIEMSNRAIRENAMFDENDQQEIFDNQRLLIQDLQKKLDDATEQNRLLMIENNQLRAEDKK